MDEWAYIIKTRDQKIHCILDIYRSFGKKAT